MISRMLRLSLCLLLAVAVLATVGGGAHHAADGHGGFMSVAAASGMDHAAAMAAHDGHEAPGDHHEDTQLSCCAAMAGGCGVWADLAPSGALSAPSLKKSPSSVIAWLHRVGITPEQNPRPPRG